MTDNIFDTSSQRQTRVGFKDFQDKDYEERKNKMDSNIEHHVSCVESPDKKKDKPPPSREYKPTNDKEKEKLEVLKDENIHLKTKKRELEEQVKQVATKLKRQINQLKKDRIVGAGGKLYGKIDDELDALIDENVRLQDEEMRLMERVKALQAKRKMELSSGFNQVKMLTATTTSGWRKSSKSRSPTRSKVKPREVELKSIRNNLEIENKKLEQLKHDVEVLRRTNQGGFQSTYATEDLGRELVQKQSKIRLEKLKYEELEETFKRKDHIYSSQKHAQDEFLKQLKDLQAEHLDLLKRNRAYAEAAKETEYLQTKIAEVTIERDKLQREFDTITRQPFFKREADQDHYKRITNIEQDIDKKDAEIKKSKTNQLKLDDDIRQLTEEYRNLNSEKNAYQEEIERLRIQLDPNSLSLADIQRKIHSLDPVMFRQVMKDLKYDGDEPIWAKFDFMERLKLGPNNQPLDEKDPIALANEINRLKLERRDLASELQKTQNLLKIQVDIDKENASLYQSRINELQSQINADNSRIGELNKVIQNRNMKLREIQNQAGKSRLTAAGLAFLDKEGQSPERPRKDEEVLSQFSVITTESEMAAQENAFELIISTASFDKSKLSQILGNRELVPSAVQTFCTVDFYNHDTKSTDLAEGFDPNYSTQFSFKNNVDDFYIQYIDMNHVVVDFFLSRAQSAPKIGTAKLPLCKLLEKDLSFQAQEIVHEGGPMGGNFPIGRVLFKMRMRKSIDEALKWYAQKKALNQQRDPTSTLSKDATGYSQPQRRSKVVTISVLRGHGFKRGDGGYTTKNIQPFFYFQFYTFEYTSPIVQGENPGFDISKTFEVEETNQFMQYMKNQILKIDFIDESVEMREGQSDYIGSARIPLREVMLNEVVADSFPVKDEVGRENGRVEIKITCQDYSKYTTGVHGNYEGSSMTISKQFEEDIKKRIAEKLSEIPYQDMDMFFDYFNFTSKDYHKIHKKDFIEFVLIQLKVQGVREQDLEMFFKTSFVLQGKEFVDRNDFKSLFEYQIREAQNKKQEIRSDIQNKYNQANEFFRSGNQRSVNFQQPNLQTTNVFLDQSLNNREDKTPSFVQKKIDFQDGNQAQNVQPMNSTLKQGKDKPLIEQIKENVYHIINKFEDVAGQGASYVNFQQFKQALEFYTSDENDIANLWGQYNIDGKFFFHQQLLRLSNAKIAEDPSLSALNKQKQFNDPRINQIKNKIKEHMFSNDYSLDDIFSYLDKDKSKGVSLQELTNGLKSFLTPEECKILFTAIDKDNSGEVSYNELITECSRINCSYVLFKVQQILEKNKNDPTYNPGKIFDRFDFNKTGDMEIQEFNDLLNTLYANIGKLEVDSLFKHFDTQGKGKITKKEFESALTKPVVLENQMEPTLHELITPLQTRLRQMNLEKSYGIIFDRFHGGKNYLHMNDLKDIIYFFLKIQLSKEEELVIARFIEEQYRKGPVLHRDNFIQLLGQRFVVKSFGKGNKTVAIDSFKKMKRSIQLKKKQLREMIEPFCDEGIQRNINIRNMKIFLFSNFSISVYELENLIDYLDHDSNGFIPMADFVKEVELA